MDLNNKHVIILGAGASGQAAAALAQAHGADVSVHDARQQIAGMPEGVKLVPNATVATGEASRCDLLVLSPGIDGTTDFVKAY